MPKINQLIWFDLLHVPVGLFLAGEFQPELCYTRRQKPEECCLLLQEK